MKLTRIGPGMLKTSDGVFRVTKHTYRLHGKPHVVWTAGIPDLMPDLATFRTERGDFGAIEWERKFEVARGYTLDQCKIRLDKYLVDAAAGTYGPRSRYGFSGDPSDVARLPVVPTAPPAP